MISKVLRRWFWKWALRGPGLSAEEMREIMLRHRKAQMDQFMRYFDSVASEEFDHRTHMKADSR